MGEAGNSISSEWNVNRMGASCCERSGDILDLSILGIVRMGLEKFQPDMGKIKKLDIFEQRK